MPKQVRHDVLRIIEQLKIVDQIVKNSEETCHPELVSGSIANKEIQLTLAYGC